MTTEVAAFVVVKGTDHEVQALCAEFMRAVRKMQPAPELPPPHDDEPE